MAPFDGRPPNVLVLGGGGLLGEAWMTGVLAGYEDATGADVRRCRRFVGTSAGSIVASSLVAGRSPRRPGSAKAGAIRPVEDPGGAPSPFAGPDREGRQVPNISAGAGAVAARLGAPIRALALRVLPEGRRSIAAFRDEVDRWAPRSTGACACAPSTPATVAASCSAAGRRPRPQSGRRLRRPARSRRSSRRCAAVTGCTSTAAPGRQQTPMPRPHGLGLVGDCDQLEVGVGERHDPVGGAVPGVAAALDGCNP